MGWYPDPENPGRQIYVNPRRRERIRKSDRKIVDCSKDVNGASLLFRRLVEAVDAVHTLRRIADEAARKAEQAEVLARVEIKKVLDYGAGDERETALRLDSFWKL